MRNKYDAIMDRVGYKYVEDRASNIATSRDIGRFEEAIGFKLIADYREFLVKFGGTMPVRGRWIVTDGGKNGDETEIASIEIFYGIDTLPSYTLSIVKDGYTDQLPARIVPIAGSPGGEICISLGGPDLGSIYWWEMADTFNDNDCVHLANTFDAFVLGLTTKVQPH